MCLREYVNWYVNEKKNYDNYLFKIKDNRDTENNNINDSVFQ